MRITNSMIRNNTSNNMSTNKGYVDTLNTQMSTQKKIDRPSDDPVIAIRALRLRSSLSEINQYYEKNIPDASGSILFKSECHKIGAETGGKRIPVLHCKVRLLLQGSGRSILHKRKRHKDVE